MQIRAPRSERSNAPGLAAFPFRRLDPIHQLLLIRPHHRRQQAGKALVDLPAACGVAHLHALPFAADQASFAQGTEMLGERRLRNLAVVQLQEGRAARALLRSGEPGIDGHPYRVGQGVEVVDAVVVIEGRGALAAPLRNTGDSVVGLGDGVTMGDSVVLDVRVDEVDECCSGCPEVEDDDEGVELRGRPPPEPPLPEPLPLPLPLPEPLPPVPELPVPCGMTLIPPQGPRRLLRARGARQGAAAVGIRARRGLPARATIERLSPSPDATRMRLHPLPA